MEKRAKHSLSHEHVTTFDPGELVPIGLTEILPGDTVQGATSALIRLGALNAPVMTPMHATICHFYVPHRLVWDDWEEFITGFTKDSAASTKTFPQITITPTAGSLGNYLGVANGTEQVVNALPFRGYAAIYNEHFRNQQLQASLVIDKTDGADATTSVVLKNVNWGKDLFTDAKASHQLGTEVTMPLAGDADIDLVPSGTNANPSRLLVAADDSAGAGRTLEVEVTSANLRTDLGTALVLDPNGRLTADLSSATGPSMRAFREAVALSRFAEFRNRVGSRYSEYLRGLGLIAPDGRLDRPEKLGSSRQTIQFSEVLQTGQNFDANSGVGSLYGHGIGSMRINRFQRYFPEHGYLHTLMYVQPKTLYEGTERHWWRTTKEQFWQRELQHIGMRAIENRELYPAHASPAATFGYSPIYDEYRQGKSRISGEMGEAAMDHWTAARLLAGDPVLNSAFITSNPTDRIFAQSVQDNLQVQVRNSFRARRLVAKRNQYKL